MSEYHRDPNMEGEPKEKLAEELVALRAENAVLKGSKVEYPQTKKGGGAEGNCAFLDRIGLGILTTDDRSVITYANKKACEIFSQPMSTIVGACLFDLPNFHFSRLFRREYDKVKSSGMPETFEDSLSSNKRFEYHISPDGRGLAIVVNDVSKNWANTEAMRVALLSVNSLAEAIFFVHNSGYIFYANEAASRTTGYTLEELKGAPIRDLIPVLNRDILSNAGKLDNGHITLESEIRRKDGHKVPVEVFVTGKLLYGLAQFIISTRDITRRRRAEEELKDARMQAELYLDLMGHDINNLNQIALGYLELAIAAAKDEELKILVSKPFEAIQNSSKLIDNVRKLQKAKAGGLRMEAIDIGLLLTELQAQYMKIPDRDVIINFTPGPVCRVMANGLIKDVFANLIGNSIKHSDPLKPIWIDISLACVDADGKKYCEVTVEDNGPGIPDAQKVNAFKRLQRDNAKTGGKGLGLYLVNSLVEDFHGNVSVEDRVPGDYTKGTRFVVTLPAVQ